MIQRQIALNDGGNREKLSQRIVNRREYIDNPIDPVI